MTASTTTSLKALFETGDTVTQDSLYDLLESYVNIVDTTAQTINSPLTFSGVTTFTKAITVQSGGTGVSAFTPNSVVVGGTTSTGKLQSVDVSGIPANYVLSFVSAGTPPIWAPPGGATVVAIANGGTGSTTAVSAFDALKQNATVSVTGVAAIATTAAVQGLSSTTTIVTPAALNGTKFASSQQTLTAGGTLSIAHGLGAVPYTCMVDLVCVSAEGGYSTNDVIENASSDYNNARGCVITPDATNINVRYGNGSPVWVVLNKTTGAAFSITAANWRAVFKASLI